MENKTVKPVPGPWHGRREGYRVRVSGDRHFNHEDECACDCDGDLPDCACGDRGCQWTAVTVGWADGNATSGGVTEADAALMIAAPDLALALRDALAFIEMHGDHRVRNDVFDYTKVCLKARAALARTRDFQFAPDPKAPEGP